MRRRKDYAGVEKIILEYDNGHEGVLWSDEYKFKLKKRSIKWKRIKARDKQ